MTAVVSTARYLHMYLALLFYAWNNVWCIRPKSRERILMLMFHSPNCKDKKFHIELKRMWYNTHSLNKNYIPLSISNYKHVKQHGNTSNCTNKEVIHKRKHTQKYPSLVCISVTVTKLTSFRTSGNKPATKGSQSSSSMQEPAGRNRSQNQKEPAYCLTSSLHQRLSLCSPSPTVQGWYHSE